MRKLLLLLLGMYSLSACTTAQNSKQDEKSRKDFTQNIGIFASSLDLLNRYFVDTIDVKETSRVAIDAMLEHLDPYTEYFSKEDTEKLEILTSGEYAGIGAIIAQNKDSIVYVNEPMKGMPADRAGLKAGDQILKVDETDFSKASSADVTKKLKGESGTTVSVLVKRYGHKEPILVKIKREKIVISPVPYYTVLSNGIGYVALTSFTDSAYDELKSAVESLLEKKIKGLILDLRNNGGGLIGQAVDIAGLFVPKGSEIVSIKGRKDTGESISYKTKHRPIAEDLPLAILINNSSASASEIVSGALQDMDRAVVIGNKSFGKGLVQSTMRLPYGGTLKLTTSKYYIPSGRSIQKIDYKSKREGKGEGIKADSLTAIFYTKAGREVHDAGGIMPDIELSRDTVPTMILYLYGNKDVFDWVTKYASEHKTIADAKTFSISDADYQDFSKMAKEKNIDYDRISGKSLEQLIEIAKAEGYYDSAKDTFDKLKEQLKPSIDRDLVNLKSDIIRYLNEAIVVRYYYDYGRRERDIFLTDNVSKKASELLLDSKEYKKILSKKTNR